MTKETSNPKNLSTRKKKKSEKDRHYIDDPSFYKALSEYQAEVKLAEKEKKPKPIVSDYIARSLMMLSRKIARRPVFCRYPFIEDMIGDAIMCCFKNLMNFKPERFPAAFPYFTMVVHNSFFQRIYKEKTALYRQYRAIIERQKEVAGDAQAESQIYGTIESDMKMREFCKKFEEKLAEKRAKSKERKRAKAAQIEFDAVPDPDNEEEAVSIVTSEEELLKDLEAFE